jgi:hypothetical protein
MPVTLAADVPQNRAEVPLAEILSVGPNRVFNEQPVPDWLFEELAPFYSDRGRVVTAHVCTLCGGHWEYRNEADGAGLSRVGVFLCGYCYMCETAVQSSPDVVRLIDKVAAYAARSAAEEVVARYLAAPARARRLVEALDAAESQLELTQASLDEK